MESFPPVPVLQAKIINSHPIATANEMTCVQSFFKCRPKSVAIESRRLGANQRDMSLRAQKCMVLGGDSYLIASAFLNFSIFSELKPRILPKT